MVPLRNLLVWAMALATIAVCGNAQAASITYSFTASITSASDSSGALGVAAGDTVSGTFSFDTEVSSSTSHGWITDVSYQDTGEIETDAVVIEGGQDGVFLDGTTVVDSNFNLDGLTVGDSETHTTVTNLSTGNTSSAYFAAESVTFYFGDADALSSTDLPTSLELDQFGGATYVVKVKLTSGEVAYAIGDITSVSRVDGGPAAVPELSASGAASSLAVILGGAYVITTRRRETAAATAG